MKLDFYTPVKHNVAPHKQNVAFNGGTVNLWLERGYNLPRLETACKEFVSQSNLRIRFLEGKKTVKVVAVDGCNNVIRNVGVDEAPVAVVELAKKNLSEFSVDSWKSVLNVLDQGVKLHK